MSRKHDLEQHIRESFHLIGEYESIIRVSSDPKEKVRAQRVVQEQKGLVEGYLDEYRSSFGDAEADKLTQEIQKEPVLESPPSVRMANEMGTEFSGPIQGAAIISGREVHQQFGGQQTHLDVQFGDVHGGTINVGGSGAPAEPSVSAKPEVDWPTLWRMMETVKTQVGEMAPPEKRQAALGEIQRLQETILQDHPEQRTLNDVTRWFIKHVPSMGNAVSEFVSFVYCQFW